MTRGRPKLPTSLEQARDIDLARAVSSVPLRFTNSVSYQICRHRLAKICAAHGTEPRLIEGVIDEWIVRDVLPEVKKLLK